MALDGVEPNVTAPPLQVLQVGVNWFCAGSGGLDQVYRDLLRTLPFVGVEPTGVVLGPPGIEAATDGQVTAFGRDGATMPERLWRARAQIRSLLRTGRFGAVAAHFAMFTAPALDQIRGTPLVVHFHGPWAGESALEGGGRLAVLAKQAVEHAVYRRADRVIVLSRAFGDIARDVSAVITHRFPAAEWAEAFATARGGQCGKVVLDWTTLDGAGS